MSSGTAFLRFWYTDLTRDCFLSQIPEEDLGALRLVCHDFASRIAPLLFANVHVPFRSSTFTRPARIAALERIGHHVRTLEFDMPHTPDTFLPPLLHPVTGEEQIFVYTPQIHPDRASALRLSEPKYGSWEMTDLLVKQYPPLFHASTDVPSFVRAFEALPSLRHLKISCPGQSSAHRYRRSVVDYALISLRIAVEQAALKQLDTLSLLPVHPAAVVYLRSNMGYGATPSATKRWAQITKLAIHMDSFPFPPNQPGDHLKCLHSYLASFPALSRLFFRWRGAKGPCPLSLDTEPGLASSLMVGSSACPRTSSFRLRPLRFPKLKYMELENAVLDASQVSSFIMDHRRSIKEFDFEHVQLRSGCWDDALAPLTRISGSDQWKEKQEEVMDVPIMLSPIKVEKGHTEKVLWENEKWNHKMKNFRAYSTLQKASSRTRDLFWPSPDHMKKFLRASVFSWR